MRANTFLLSLCSPTLHEMICQGAAKGLELYDVDGHAFAAVLGLWCGRDAGLERELHEVLQLASVASWLQMTEVVDAVEKALLGHLRAGACPEEVLARSSGIGLRRLEEEAAARRAAAGGAAVAGSAAADGREQAGAAGATGPADGRDSPPPAGRPADGRLAVRAEEAAWEALVGRSQALREEAARREAAAYEVTVVTLLGAEPPPPRAAAPALGGAPGAEPAPGAADAAADPGGGGGERRLEGHAGEVNAVVECGGRVCSGSSDGSILVWDRATLALERTLRGEGAADPVSALAVWGGRLVSGHGGARDGRLRVWDLDTGGCEQVLEGHTRRVWALAVCGARLVSGSEDKYIKVWAAPPGAPRACERTLPGHSDWVRSLAAWRGKVISGSGDDSIRVWDVATGALDATLAGHGGGVCGLVVLGDRLASASRDGTIRVWEVGTWAALRTVAAYPADAGQYPRCLAVGGGRLVSGSCARAGAGARREVRVWRCAAGAGLEALECERALPQPAGDNVSAVAAVGEEVWAGVGRAVVVWALPR